MEGERKVALWLLGGWTPLLACVRALSCPRFFWRRFRNYSDNTDKFRNYY